MTDRDTRETTRPAASELDVGEIRKLARNENMVADMIEEALQSSDLIARRCLERIVPITRETAKSLYALAASIEARP